VSDRYAEALALVIGAQTASTSFMQRKLHMGYNEACRYIERMEAEGHVGKPNNVGRREVLVHQLTAAVLVTRATTHSDIVGVDGDIVQGDGW
jgi:DNA segregation ATPase FtsK/SpoIIIE-like protein